MNSTLPGIVAAQAPAAAPVGNAGHYRFQVGDIAATVLSDGVIGGPPAIYAGDAPEAELPEVLRRAFLPTDFMTLNLNTLLLEIDGRRVLLEAGAGTTMGPNGGRLFDNLRAIGLSADDIDLIVISHTHPDHVGNLRTADGGRAFSRARVMASKPNWSFFVQGEPDLSYMPVSPEFRQRFAASIKRSVQPFARDIELYEGGAEILPGLTAIAAYGHTPGMAAFLVHSGSDQLLLTADLAYHPVINIEQPWRPGADRDQEAAAQVRRRIFDQAAADLRAWLPLPLSWPRADPAHRCGLRLGAVRLAVLNQTIEGGIPMKTNSMSIDRRKFLGATAAAVGIATAGASRAYAQASQSSSRSIQPAITRQIGRTGRPVTTLGLGTFLTFDLMPGDSRERLREVVSRYVAGGGGVIDTSPLYGLAEVSVGAFLSEMPEARDIFLANKIWSTGEYLGDTSHAAASFEQSKLRVWRSRIDLMQCHSITNAAVILPLLQAWKKEGRSAMSGSPIMSRPIRPS